MNTSPPSKLPCPPRRLPRPQWTLSHPLQMELPPKSQVLHPPHLPTCPSLLLLLSRPHPPSACPRTLPLGPRSLAMGHHHPLLGWLPCRVRVPRTLLQRRSPQSL